MASEPARRRPMPDALIQIETAHVLCWPPDVPEGYARCTQCGLVMDRDEWARTQCAGKRDARSP